MRRPTSATSLSRSRADRAGGQVRRLFAGKSEMTARDFVLAVGDISEWRQTHAYPLSLVTPGLRKWVGQEGSPFAAVGAVGQRLKRFDRIMDKLRRLPSMRLSQMEDIGGCRAVLATPDEVQAVAGRIRRRWDVVAESDYRERGKDLTGYRCLHIVVRRQDRLIEIQLRTDRQHYWAEVVERTSSRTGYHLKDGEGPSELLDYFRVASDISWRLDNQAPVEQELEVELTNLRRQVAQYFR